MRHDTDADLYARWVNPARFAQLGWGQIPRTFPDAEGAWLSDASGRRYLDLHAGYGTVVLGHRPPPVMAAISTLVGSPGPAFVSAMGVPPIAGSVAATLCRIAGHGLAHVYFASSGAEAIESALKFAIAATGRREFVSFSGCFHGMTLAALSLTDIAHLRQRFTGTGVNTHTVAVGDVDRVRQLLREHEVAAVLIEVVQGMAGAKSWDPLQLSEVSSLCEEHGALMIVDEVLTGLGRTGNWFAFHGANLKPSIVVVSKALTAGVIPVSAVLMTAPVYDAVFSSQPSIHSSTFEANLLAMTVAQAVLRLLEEPAVRKHIDQVGTQLSAGLERIAHESGGVIRGIRGAGLLLGVEISDAYAHDQEIWGAAAFRQQLASHGVLCQLAGANPSVLLLLPPYSITAHEVTVALAAFRAAAGQ